MDKLTVENHYKIQIDQLKKGVDIAFDNRVKTKYVDVEELNTTGHVQSANNVIDQIKRSPGEHLNFQFPKNKNMVYTTESHLYPQLILLAYEKLDNKRAPSIHDIQESLNEEYKHVAPIIGDEKVKIGYAIEFEEVDGNPIIIPQVIFNGQIKKEVFIDMLTNPETQSLSDKEIKLQLNIPSN